MSKPHSVPFSVDSALDAYTEQRTGPRPNDLQYHPSSLYACDRKVIYEVRDTPRELDFKPGDNRPLLVGTTLGELLQAAVLEQVGTSLRSAVVEPRISVPELHIAGSVDAFVVHMDGTPEVVENKTINSNSLRMSKKAGQMPKPEHANQALTYAYAIRHHGYWTPGVPDDDYCCPNCNTPWSCNGPHIPEKVTDVYHAPVPDLRQVRVAYWDKDRHAVHEYVLQLTAAWEEQFLAHISKLDRYRTDGTALPPRLVERQEDHWLCRSYCDFRSRCFSIDSEGVEL